MHPVQTYVIFRNQGDFRPADRATARLLINSPLDCILLPPPPLPPSLRSSAFFFRFLRHGLFTRPRENRKGRKEEDQIFFCQICRDRPNFLLPVRPQRVFPRDTIFFDATYLTYLHRVPLTVRYQESWSWSRPSQLRKVL